MLDHARALPCLLLFAACAFDSSGAATGQAADTGVTPGSDASDDAPRPSTSSQPDSTGSSAEASSITTATGADSSTSGDPTVSSTAGSTETTTGSTTAAAAVAELPQLRIELPCMGGGCVYSPDDVCQMDLTVQDQTMLDGDPGEVYDVTIRVRGVVEMSSYIGGLLDGDVYVGGMLDSYWSPFSLVVSDPSQTYWLNPGGDGDLFTYGVDYSHTVTIADGASVTLRGGSGDDSCGLFNHDQADAPIVVGGVPPDPLPFDGQFLQVDAETIVTQ